MALKDFFSKGMDMIKDSAKAVGDAAASKKAAMQEFDLLKTRCDKLGPLNPYEVHNADAQEGKEQLILNLCFALNVESAKLINSVIPIEETVIDVKVGKEAQTEIDYSFVATDKKLWIINKNTYMTMDYENVKECAIINKGIMSQSVKFDDKAIVLDGNEADVKRFFEVIKNPEVRNELIKHKVAYLLGVIPRKQVLNMNMRGVTIGDNGVIVLHGANENRIVNVDDIVSVQLMVNDTAALIRGKTDSSNFMSSPMEARKMAVKIVFKMGEYLIETMPQGVMNTSYRREDATYVKNYNFAKKLVDTLGELIKDDPMKVQPPINGSVAAGNVSSNPVLGTVPNQGVNQPVNPTTTNSQPVVSNPTPSVVSNPTPSPAPSSIPTINPFTNPMATGGVNLDNNSNGTGQNNNQM